jgi:hypothetical protein
LAILILITLSLIWPKGLELHSHPAPTEVVEAQVQLGQVAGSQVQLVIKEILDPRVNKDRRV